MDELVDRPMPKTYDYRGVTYVVRFKWGEPTSQIPIGATIEFDAEPGKALSVTPSSPWSDIDDAEANAKEVAEAYINKKKG